MSMSNTLVREWLNGGLIPINLCIIYITIYSVWKSTRFKWGWSLVPGASSACALMWIFIADLTRSVLAWSILRHAEHNQMYMSPEATFLYLSAGIIATCATMRLIYVMSPKSWGHKGWLTALMLTSLFFAFIYGGGLDFISLAVVHVQQPSR